MCLKKAMVQPLSGPNPSSLHLPAPAAVWQQADAEPVAVPGRLVRARNGGFLVVCPRVAGGAGDGGSAGGALVLARGVWVGDLGVG